MKKSELRTLIREVLREELLHEGTGLSIDQKGLLSSMNSNIAHEVGGCKFQLEGKESITVPQDVSIKSGYNNQGGYYSYLCTLAADLPKEATLSPELKKGLQNLQKIYSKPDSAGRYDSTFRVFTRGTDKLSYYVEVRITPKPGCEMVV